jgi:hypothetical protein
MPCALKRIVAACAWVGIFATIWINAESTVAAIVLPRGGINVAPYGYWGTALPFFDVAHMGDHWNAVSPNGDEWLRDRTIEVNALGYPISLSSDEVARSSVFTHNGSQYPVGQYVLTWSGSGNVRLKNSHEVSVISQTPGKITYNVSEVNPNGLWLEITQTDSANPVSNIGLHAPFANGDGAFNPKYKADMANYGVIRYMDWNSTNNQPISKWVDRTTLYDMHWGNRDGVPYEAQIQLSNDTKKDLWLTVPHLADDDYVHNLATLVAQRLSPDLRVWVEYSNEVWNGAFRQYEYANEVLRPKYGVENPPQAYGRRSAEIFDVFQHELNDDRRVVRVIGGQTANPWVLQESLKGATIDGAVKADVAAVAPYFTVDIDALYQRHLAGTVNMDDVFTELRASIDAVMVQVAVNHQKASQSGLPLVAYEGGQHLVARLGEQHNNTSFVELLKTINRDPRMGDLYTYYLEQWNVAGGKTITLYYDTANYSKWGNWGLKENYQDDNAPKFRAVQSYLERLERDAADFNKDGVIDLVDYQTWRLTVGSPILHADANGDGVVDKADYVVWRRYYGLEQQAAGNGSFGETAVPEPATIYFTFAGLCLYSWPPFERRSRATTEGLDRIDNPWRIPHELYRFRRPVGDF